MVSPPAGDASGAIRRKVRPLSLRCLLMGVQAGKGSFSARQNRTLQVTDVMSVSGRATGRRNGWRGFRTSGGKMNAGKRRSWEINGGGRLDRCHAGGKHLMQQFRRDRGKGRFRRIVRIFRIDLAGFGDLAAEFAGLFAAEGILGSFHQTVLLRVADEHVHPGTALQNRIRAANQMEAAEKNEQELERLLQGVTEFGSARTGGFYGPAGEGAREKKFGFLHGFFPVKVGV